MAQEAFTEYSFDELEINEKLKKAVAGLGFQYMTPIQAEAIPALLTGRDIIGQAQTGTGKTAAFGLPILDMIAPLNKQIQAVILCPTRELAMQVTNEIRNFAKYMENIKVLPVYGGQDIQVQIRSLKGVQIIVGTPGRVMDHMRRHTIKMDNVRMVVLDEADEMLDMGFREDMEVILGTIEGKHQTCMFSATMPDEILELTNRFLNDPQMVKVTQKALTIERIKQYYYPVKHEFKDAALLRLLRYHGCNKCMIFVNTKGKADEVSDLLQKEGYAADALHGDLSQKARDSVMGRFRNGRINILIATDIAARGIDVGNVEAVYNYDVPQEIEYYVHRIGRTGRAGKEGASHTICGNRDFYKIREIEKHCHCTMEESRVPDAATIQKAYENATLNRILSIMNEGHSGRLIPVISRFCEENNITPEAFAAACLKKELGVSDKNDKDNIDVNLAKKSGRRNKPERINYGFSANIFKPDLREYRKDYPEGKKKRKDKEHFDLRRDGSKKSKRRNG